MHITAWGINYSPEVTGIAPFNTALCEYLRAEGHQVRMVTTFPYYPAWEKIPGDRGYLYRTDDFDGVTVHRCWHYVPGKVSALRRILHEFSFVLTSFVRQVILPRPDLLVVVSPPLLLGIAAWALCLLKRAPFVLHVQDLQPDAAVSLGMLKPSLMTNLLYGLEAFGYRKAAKISGITQGMLDAFAKKGVPLEKIVYFPNGVEVPAEEELPSRGEFRRRMNLAETDFLAVYSGNLGMKQGLGVLAEAARIVSSKKIKIIICGDGAYKSLLEEKIARERLENIMLLPLQPETYYRQMLRDADLVLITQQAGSGAAFFPSKLLKALAMRKPILAVADEESELCKAIASGRFGLVVPPKNHSLLAETLESLAGQPAQLAEYERNGLDYIQQFDQRTIHQKFLKILIRAAGAARE